MVAVNADGAIDFAVSVVRYAADVETTDAGFRALMAGIAGSRWMPEVARVRKAFAAGGKDAAAPLKLKLPGVLWSGTFNRRASGELRQHSGLICVDLDNLGDRVEALREHIVAEEHTLACFVSPTGTGLKVLFRCDPGRPHLESFHAAERHVLMAFGLEVDKACKDVARLCFVSDDPDAFVASDATPLDYPLEKVEFKASAERMAGVRLLAGLTPGDDFDARGDLPSLLTEHGWTKSGTHYWVRPGKTSGVSASLGKVPGRFYSFTSSTEFEANHVYRPWHVFALLKCGGDFTRAARELGALGFGEQRPKSVPSAFTTGTDEQAAIDAANETVFVEGTNGAESPAEELEKGKHPKDSGPKATQALRDRCNARVFRFLSPPTEPIPRFLINGKPICTAGNLTSNTAQSKTGKSSFLEAMMAAVGVADNKAYDRDTLGVTATAPNGLNVVHFDTEQSIYDHDQLIRRVLRRAALDTYPAWLHSFCLTGFTAGDIRRLVRLKLEDAKGLGGVFAFLLDGVADCVLNVNDPEECNPFVAELHELAIEFDCPIICNLHENPGQDFGKGRGHLGSQLERKAESNLRLRKADDVITVFSDKMRKGSILEKDGPRFTWDHREGMHMSCPVSVSVQELAKRSKLQDILDEVFHQAGKEKLRYADLVKAIATTTGVGPSRAEARFSEMKKMDVISKDMLGFWGSSAKG